MQVSRQSYQVSELKEKTGEYFSPQKFSLRLATYQTSIVCTNGGHWNNGLQQEKKNMSGYIETNGYKFITHTFEVDVD